MDAKWMIKDWTTGELNALVKNLGEGTAREIQKGGVRVKLEKVERKLFDKNGRRIPREITARVCDSYRRYELAQPKLDYEGRLARLHQALGKDTGISISQFLAKVKNLLALIQDNFLVANIKQGIWLPVVMPQLTTYGIGWVLEDYLRMADNSLQREKWPEKSLQLCNHLKERLAGRVSFVQESGYSWLIEKLGQKPRIGIYFPFALQGFSVEAQREQMLALPKGFFLSGLDVIIGLTMYPDFFLREWENPELDLSGFFWKDFNYSFCLKISSQRVDFFQAIYLKRAYRNSSGGLLFLDE